jgi:hypothetical protein
VLKLARKCLLDTGYFFELQAARLLIGLLELQAARLLVAQRLIALL